LGDDYEGGCVSEKIIEMELEKLIPYARNPRKNDHAVDKIAGAIREFGFKVPVIAKSDGTVVDGHLRLKAAQKLGMEAVPVLLADDLSDAQIKAFRLSVNKMAELAEWDDELLHLELDELRDMDFNLDLTGFDDRLLANLLDDKIFSPSDENSQGSLDRLEPKYIKCPHCQKSFDTRLYE